jgi:hypothetical protein
MECHKVIIKRSLLVPSEAAGASLADCIAAGDWPQCFLIFAFRISATAKPHA